MLLAAVRRAATRAREVDGQLLTQRLNGHDASKIHEWLVEKLVHPHVTAEKYVANLEAQGLRTDIVEEWRSTMEFADVEALVAYLALVPWH